MTAKNPAVHMGKAAYWHGQNPVLCGVMKPLSSNSWSDVTCKKCLAKRKK